MVITLSHPGALRIQTGGLTIVQEGTGAVPARLKPDIFLRSSRAPIDLPDAGFIIHGPGEYEIQGIEIRCIAPFSYIMKAEDLRIALIPRADMQLMDHLNRIDIVFIAEPENAATFLRQLSPRMVIETGEAAGKIAKELGAAMETADKVTVKKRDLPSDAMQFTCLTA